MRIEVRAVYTYNREIEKNRWTWVHRYATLEADVPHAEAGEAPAVMFAGHGDRTAFRYHGGRFFVDTGYRPFAERGPDEMPLLISSGNGAYADRAAAESPEDVAADRAWELWCEARSDRDFRDKDGRAASLRKAEEWLQVMLIRRDEDGRLVGVWPAREPLIAVLPPGAVPRSRLMGRFGLNKLPGTRLVFGVDTDRLDEDSREEFDTLLREDRWFRADETAEAVERAMEFGDRVHRGGDRVEVLDPSALRTDLSTLALRLTAREASAALRRRRVAPEVSAARTALLTVAAERDANAAALCPLARSFLASFQASAEMLELSRRPGIADALERLERAHARAQKRMAANRIPDRDPRALAPEDDLAIGKLVG